MSRSQTPLRVGWIGLGVMGRSMAGHLLGAGHQLVCFTRTKSTASELLARGALWADSPSAVAEQCDILFSMVGMPSDVEEVHLGSRGTLAGQRVPAIMVDMTTSSPTLARRIHTVANTKGVSSLDTPVSGGDIGAREARLSIMVGGDLRAFESTQPLLALMGTTIVHHGGPGAGQHAKMCNQILVAASMIGMCEALTYAEAAGLDPVSVQQSVSGGAAGSWTVSNLMPRVLRGDFAPGFFVEHFLKDLGIALAEAESMELNLEGLTLAHRAYRLLADSGEGRRGTQALAQLLSRNRGWPQTVNP